MRYGSSSPEKFFNVDLPQIGAQIANEIRVEEMGLVEDRSSFLEFCQIEKRCSIEQHSKSKAYKEPESTDTVQTPSMVDENIALKSQLQAQQILIENLRQQLLLTEEHNSLLMQVNDTQNQQLDEIQCKAVANSSCQTTSPYVYTQSKGAQTYQQSRPSSRITITNQSLDNDQL